MRLRPRQPGHSSSTLALIVILFLAAAVRAQTTAFTYQGRLVDSGNPANGNYDLQFALFDSSAGGAQIGSTQSVNAVSVNGGIFTVQLDFGVNAFPGANRFLEISVRPAGGGNFTVLSPRQQISSTPYAIRTLSAAVADTAANATQLGGVAASQYVQTNDARLSDARSPTAGSSNYVQSNPSSPQAGANFNISGNGTAGGTLNGNVVNATTQFNLNGNRMLSAPGTDNLFAGASAGQANTSGNSNVFVGPGAGQANTVGARNSFFGLNAGRNNAGDAFGNGSDNSFFGNGAGTSNTGQQNSFFGLDAGAGNTTGNFNSFFGQASGLNHTTGGSNTFIGSNTGFNSAGPGNTSGSYNTAIGFGAKIQVAFGNNLTNATAIGANAFVTQENSLVLGSINGFNNATADTSVGIGTPSPGDKLEVRGVNGPGVCNVVTILYGTSGGKPGCGDALGIATDDPSKNFIDTLNPSGTAFAVRGNGDINTIGVLSVGTLTAVRTLTVNGRARIGSIPLEASAASVCFNAAGDLLQCGASSLRWKTNVQAFRSGLDIIRRLRPISFNWKEDGRSDVGLGAEDVAKVAPSLTIVDAQGQIAGVKYDRLNVVLINAIKEQQIQIARQQRQINQLRAEIRQRRLSPRGRRSFSR